MRSIWAVAVNTIRQALRMKVAAVFTVMLIVLLPVMGHVMTGDGTLKGKLQTFVNYSLSLTTFLLCLLTIVVSTYSLAYDIKQKQIYTVITKPLRRFQLILGKLLGLILLDAVLLTLFALLIYLITIYTPKFANTTEQELAQAKDEFYTARASLVPQEADVSEEVRQTYKKLEQKGQLPTEMTYEQIIESLTDDFKKWKRAVVPGQQLVWNFENIKNVDPNQNLFIRYKYDTSSNPPDSQVLGKWSVGDDRQIRMKTPIYRVDRKELIDTFHEIQIPADAVADDGYIAVGFYNDPQFNRDTVIIFPPKDGFELLYKADTFTANFIKAVFLIFFRLFFLACMGLLTSTFLSFPVAVLLSLVIFFTSSISSFCFYSFEFLSKNLSSVYYYTIRPIISLLPQFDKFTPADFLVPARLLSWSLLAKIAGLMVCIKAVLLLLLSLLIFSFREIAKVII